jgi:uncharacterized DUF497 family protein
MVSGGELGGYLVAIIWMAREDGIRLISLRKARDGERRCAARDRAQPEVQQRDDM